MALRRSMYVAVFYMYMYIQYTCHILDYDNHGSVIPGITLTCVIYMVSVTMVLTAVAYPMVE